MADRVVFIHDGRVVFSGTVDALKEHAETLGLDSAVFAACLDQGKHTDEVAAAIGTIPYEVLARVGPRVQRILSQH